MPISLYSSLSIYIAFNPRPWIFSVLFQSRQVTSGSKMSFFTVFNEPISASLLFVAVLFVVRSNGMIINNGAETVDNDVLNNSPPARISGFRAKDWIKMSQSPPQVVHARLGERIEFECEVLGSPAPEIKWFRGSQLLQQTERGLINNDLQDSYHDKAGLAKIKSRLIIDCVTPHHEGLYTCVAVAGVKKIESQPSWLRIEGGNDDYCKQPQEQRLQPPRIISWNPTAMENMGVDVLLPCAAVGNPTPVVYWLDQDNNVVNNFRYRVLDNGDLAIYRLAWPDMGQYKCVAENSLGRDSVTTFIYPVLNEK